MESSKEEKAETMGKEKVVERKDNVYTKSHNHQKNSGQADLGNNGQNNLGTQKPTCKNVVTFATRKANFDCWELGVDTVLGCHT